MEEEGSGTIEGRLLQHWRLRQADGEVLAEKEGCVGTVEVRRWRMWNTGC